MNRHHGGELLTITLGAIDHRTIKDHFLDLIGLYRRDKARVVVNATSGAFRAIEGLKQRHQDDRYYKPQD